jgi:hypothetical protein
MSQEEKNEEKVEETTEEQASESENKQSEEKDVNYYKEELDKISQAEQAKAEQLRKAEHKLTEQDKELRELKRAKESQDEDGRDSESENESDVDEKIKALKSEMVQSQLEVELAKIENSEERELTKKYYQDKLAHSGTSATAIAEDVENARFLANKAKYQAREAEIIKSAQSSRSASSDSGVAGDMEEQKSGPKLNATEQSLLERRGLKPEDVGKDIRELSN